jgi:hypothetical protein
VGRAQHPRADLARCRLLERSERLQAPLLPSAVRGLMRDAMRRTQNCNASSSNETRSHHIARAYNSLNQHYISVCVLLVAQVPQDLANDAWVRGVALSRSRIEQRLRGWASSASGVLAHVQQAYLVLDTHSHARARP